MNNLPFNVSDDPFDSDLWGSFGSFTTRESYELDYILTSIPISKIGMISTATEAFDVAEINFDELIQRDIAQDRVLKIVNEYLEHGEERVIFFPPLLATLIIVEDDKIKDQYESVEVNAKDGKCIWTLDSDKFQVELPISESPTDMQVHCGEKMHYIYQFGCKLRFNSDSTRLVVLDGQHRLSALRHLHSNREKKDAVKNVRIPVCIVYTPGAKSNTGQSIKRNLRELFVRINTTGKSVSGHFVRLLDDSSLTSMTVREVANSLKREDFDGLSGLHLIEWNQRSDKRTHQIERAYSVTTISIIADALEASVFKDHKRFKEILRLREYAGDWPSDDVARGLENIRDGEFSEAEGNIVREQAKQVLVPPFLLLFTKPKIYSKLIGNVSEAYRWLNEAVESGRDGAGRFREILVKEFRRADRELDGFATYEVSKEFEGKIEKYKKDELHEPYFLNVFQQGLIEVWAELGMHASRYMPEYLSISQALVDALEKLPLNPDKQYFSSNRKYTNNTLYRNGRVVFNKGNRDQWKNLLWASFLAESVREAFRDGVSGIISESDLDEFLDEITHRKAKRAFFEVIDFYETQELKTLKKNWEISGLPEEDVNSLNDAYQLSRRDPDDETFDMLVDKLSRLSAKAAKERLENILECSHISRGE